MTKFLSHVWIALCSALVFVICFDEARAYEFRYPVSHCAVEPSDAIHILSLSPAEAIESSGAITDSPVARVPEWRWELNKPGLMFLLGPDDRKLGYAVASNPADDERDAHPFMLVYIDSFTGHASFHLCETLVECKDAGVRRWRERREMGLDAGVGDVKP